jgi:hypothetical protein
VTPQEPMIPSGKDKTTVKVEAAKDAPTGKANIDVIAVPQSGKTVSLQMAVRVQHG